ncbi:ABC transporter permease [Georgenia daeguensis]|uniref:ABC transporter permease n=1 Tax=Georgenia daeguensis TaxID=908355 RepID=A0ABP8EV88_9MICO
MLKTALPRRRLVSASDAALHGGDPGSDAEQVQQSERFRAKLAHTVRHDRGAQFGIAFLGVVLASSVLSPLFVTDALVPRLDMRFTPPTLEHGWHYVLGADALGRSFLARLVVAGRTTLLIALVAVLLASVIGSMIGATVGYVRGAAETVVMRVTDVMLAFPSLLLALIVLYILGPGVASLMFVLAIGRLPAFTRVARGEALAVRERVFITASRSLGSGPFRIMAKQILPVIAPPLVALATLEFALIILAESALSFLGLGIQAPDVTWGGLIAEGRNYLRDAWWVALLPGLVITLTAVSVNLVADAVRRTNETD